MKRFAALATPLALVVLLMPAPAQAAFYGPIVPAACKCDKQTVEGTNVQVTTAPDYGCVLQVIQNVLNVVVTLATLVMVFYIVIAGLQFIMSGSGGEALSKAKTRITNVVIGIVVVLVAWLLIDYVMKTIYNEKGEFGPWNSILGALPNGIDRCIVARKPSGLTSGFTNIVFTGNEGGGAPGTGTGTGIISGNVLSDTQVRSAFRTNGITIASGFSAASSFANTRADTVNQVIEIKQSCGCSVQVNATTGGSHQTSGTATHANGFKVDLQAGGAIDGFLSRLRRSGSRSDGTPLYYDGCGNAYAKEAGSGGGHWDITVDKGVCNL